MPPRGSGSPRGLSIKERLERQEDTYVRVVQDRHARIRQYGPSPQQLQGFPSPDVRAPYLLWDFFPAAFNCPYETERVGVMGDGGKWVCGLSRIAEKRHCVVYSAGISTESSFEAELIKRTNCEVFGFDYSVEKFGPEVHNYESIRAKSHFYQYGISGSDDHNGHPPMWTLQSLMKKHGHTFIDILKVDIEGYEFDTLTSMVKYYKEHNLPLPFGQLQLEIHAESIAFADYLKWWEDLEEAGLRPFWTEANVLVNNWYRDKTPSYAEYSFLNIGLDHEIVRD